MTRIFRPARSAALVGCCTAGCDSKSLPLRRTPVSPFPFDIDAPRNTVKEEEVARTAQFPASNPIQILDQPDRPLGTRGPVTTSAVVGGRNLNATVLAQQSGHGIRYFYASTGHGWRRSVGSLQHIASVCDHQCSIDATVQQRDGIGTRPEKH